MTGFIAVLIFIALGLMWKGKSERSGTGIDEEIIYSDLDHFSGGGDLLKVSLDERDPSSELHGITLCGKPDNVGSSGVPYEFKSGKSPASLYEGYRLQVLAYGVMMEKLSGKMPPHGIVRFKDGKEFKVEYTKSGIDLFMQKLHSLVEVIRHKRNPVRNHDNSNKCNSCEYFSLCEHKINKETRSPK